MNDSVLTITAAGLVWAFVPAAFVVGILYRWTGGGHSSIHALARMLGQLLLVGYVLVFIFEAQHAGLILLVLLVMLLAATGIAIRPLQQRRPQTYRDASIAILVGSAIPLVLTTQIVIPVDPWYLPRYVVPLGGMMLSSAMNAVSLSAERHESECRHGRGGIAARGIALNAAMIPVVNSLFAVGLVSLPGMMTGQILSGVSPFIAAKYQIVIMSMLFASSGIAAALYLWLVTRRAAAALQKSEGTP